MLNKSAFQLIGLFVCLFYLGCSDACYITNCPWGGKRSVGQNLGAESACRSCANGLGTCFGPRICCGDEIGCLLDTQASLSCRYEDLKSKTPCTPYGKECNKAEFGRCATRTLCCSPDACVHDTSCNESEAESSDFNDEDRKILKTLLLAESNKNHRFQET